MSFHMIPHERLQTGVDDLFAAFACLIHHPEEFEVCEANGELFVRPRVVSGRSKAKWPMNVNLEHGPTLSPQEILGA
jgi:hypothetical protein